MLSFTLMILGWVIYFLGLATGEVAFFGLALGFFLSSVLAAIMPADNF